MVEDVHRDGSIDLRDAISAVRQFEGSAQHPETFAKTIRTAVATLEVAADMKTVIKTDISPTAASGGAIFTPTLLAASAVVDDAFGRCAFNAAPLSDDFISAEPTTPTPPPKLA